MKPKTYNCPVEAAIAVFGGKWKTLILWWLHQRTWRFAELRRQILEDFQTLRIPLRAEQFDAVLARIRRVAEAPRIRPVAEAPRIPPTPPLRCGGPKGVPARIIPQ